VADAGVADAEPLPDRAARPVRRDQVVGPHGPLVPALPAPDHGGHSLRVLLAPDELGAEAEVAAEVARGARQDRLQVILAALAPARRAEPGMLAVRVDLPDKPFTVS